MLPQREGQRAPATTFFFERLGADRQHQKLNNLSAQAPNVRAAGGERGDTGVEADGDRSKTTYTLKERSLKWPAWWTTG